MLTRASLHVKTGSMKTTLGKRFWMCLRACIKLQHLVSNNFHLEMEQGMLLNIYSPLVICKVLFSSFKRHSSGLNASTNNFYHLWATSDKTDLSVSAISYSGPLSLVLYLYFTMTRDSNNSTCLHMSFIIFSYIPIKIHTVLHFSLLIHLLG